MLVYKFGGASVKDANAVRQLKNIVGKCNENLIVIISAMDKTTNKLEDILLHAFKGDGSFLPLINKLKSYHLALIKDLLLDDKQIINEVNKIFESHVLLHPEQYFWVHKRFKMPSEDTPDPYSECK